MYLRTTKRKNKDGSVVAYYQIAHNRWDSAAGRSTVDVLLNLGRADELDRGAMVRLCESVAKVCGAEVVSGVESRALREIGVSSALQLGVPHLVSGLWERLGIGPALRDAIAAAGVSAELEPALLAIVANRLDAPTSKLGVWERWLEHVYMPRTEGLSLDRFYEALDFLHEHHQAIEESVFFHVAKLLNLEVDVVLYDTTTAEFCLDDADGDEGMRRLGHSKDSRWTPQVVIALAVTREGLPVRSWVFPGNTADVTTVERIRADLRGWKLGRTLFIGDAGMNSEANRESLMRGAGRYVLACGTASTVEVVQEVLGRAGRYKEVTPDLHVKEVVVGEGELRRRYLVCRNPSQATRQASHRQQVLAELEVELTRHKDTRLDRAWVARLRASRRYGPYLSVRKGRLVIDRAKVDQDEKRDGKWVLITNDDTLSPADAAQAYKALLVVENCFRTMKSVQIEVRPMFHRLDRRIVAHVKVCVLALLISRVAEIETRLSWKRVHDILSHLQAVDLRDSSHRLLRSTDPSPDALAIYRAVQVEPPRLILASTSLAGPSRRA